VSPSWLLRHYRNLGVEFSITPAGKLHVEAPDGTLTEEAIAGLRAHRDELIAALTPLAWPPPTPSWWKGWMEEDDRRRAETMRAGLERRADLKRRHANGDES
jgi:hypothetical protein